MTHEGIMKTLRQGMTTPPFANNSKRLWSSCKACRHSFASCRVRDSQAGTLCREACLYPLHQVYHSQADRNPDTVGKQIGQAGKPIGNEDLDDLDEDAVSH